MIPIETNPHDVRGDNDFPYHASCAGCKHKTMQIDGSLWCTQYKDEVDGEHVCERWSQGGIF